VGPSAARHRDAGRQGCLVPVEPDGAAPVAAHAERVPPEGRCGRPAGLEDRLEPPRGGSRGGAARHHLPVRAGRPPGGGVPPPRGDLHPPGLALHRRACPAALAEAAGLPGGRAGLRGPGPGPDARPPRWAGPGRQGALVFPGAAGNPALGAVAEPRGPDGRPAPPAVLRRARGQPVAGHQVQGRPAGAGHGLCPARPDRSLVPRARLVLGFRLAPRGGEPAARLGLRPGPRCARASSFRQRPARGLPGLPCEREGPGQRPRNGPTPA